MGTHSLPCPWVALFPCQPLESDLQHPRRPPRVYLKSEHDHDTGNDIPPIQALTATRCSCRIIPSESATRPDQDTYLITQYESLPSQNRFLATLVPGGPPHRRKGEGEIPPIPICPRSRKHRPEEKAQATVPFFLTTSQYPFLHPLNLLAESEAQ